MLRRGSNAGSDVGLGLAGGKPLLPRNAGQGSGQIVPDLLQALCQMGVVQGEADPIFDHPQPFTGAIGGRVEDPQQGHVVGNGLGIHVLAQIAVAQCGEHP